MFKEFRACNLLNKGLFEIKLTNFLMTHFDASKQTVNKIKLAQNIFQIDCQVQLMATEHLYTLSQYNCIFTS